MPRHQRPNERLESRHLLSAGDRSVAHRGHIVPGLTLHVEPLDPRTLLSASLFASLPSTDNTTPASIATDPQGNVYLAGRFSGTIDLDPSPSNSRPLTAYTSADLYLAKYSPAGALI